MIVIKNENIVCYDVDMTLVSNPRDNHIPGSGDIRLTNPYSETEYYFDIFNEHVELLKQHKGRGNFIIVWSAGGVLWAERVVKALELESYVDIIATKPTKYVDDLSVEKWFGPRIYLK